MGKSQSKSVQESNNSHKHPTKKKQSNSNPTVDVPLKDRSESANPMQILSTTSNRSHSMASSSCSTSGSYIDEQMFKYIGGRKFIILEDARYILPFDDDEHARVQIQHFTFRHIWGSNFSAPIHELLQDSKTKVLDIGCATGTWTLDMATEYPLAKFTGIDIIPIFPSEIKPKNVEFEIANILNGLPYEDDTFDFVFMRSMCLSFTTQEWESMAINELVRVLKPGGWIEIMERDPWWSGAGPATDRFNRIVVDELLTRHNINAHISPHIQKYMSETHKLSRICHLEKKIAVGPWGGNLGNVCLENYKWLSKNLQGNVESLREKEFKSMLNESLKEFKNSKAYETGHRFFAMKREENVGMETI